MKGEYYSVDTDDMAAYITMRNYMKANLYSIPYYKQMETELLELERNNGTGHIDHMNNPNGKEPVHFKDLIDAFAGASFHLFTRENISYEDLIVQRNAEKIRERVPDDGFFSTISHDMVEYDIDAEAEFKQDLYGEESSYVLMDDLK